MEISNTLTKEFLSRLNALSLRLNEKLQGGLSGSRRSSARGSSIEFSDFKPYVLGDSIRHIDWNSYARLDKLFIKLYMEEKQANINIIIDCSKSMSFENKAYYSQLLAAVLAYLAINNTDKVNLYALSSENCVKLENASTKARFNEIVSTLEALEYDGECDFSELREIRSLKKGLTILISDCLTEPEKTENTLRLLQFAKQETILVQVLSKNELSPELSGDISLIDSETEEKINLRIDETTSIIEDYKSALQAFNAELIGLCKKHHVGFISLSTESEIMQAIKSFI